MRAATTILGGASTAPVRALAFTDGRRAVRLAFLSAAATTGFLEHLPGTVDDIAAVTGASRLDRLAAWLRIGVELRELDTEDGQFTVIGRRARAIAANDSVVTPFYRSVAEYYMGPHQDLANLIGDHPGRTDLSQSATTIAEVSRVTEPLLAGVLREVVETQKPSTWLEVGCGSGVHLTAAMMSRAALRAVAVDLDRSVIASATEEFERAGVADRVELRVGDVLDVVQTSERFNVITLLNNIYYFEESDRQALISRLLGMLEPGGELVVASQCAANPNARSSVAAAQLDFLLRVQREAVASLPTSDDLRGLFPGAATEVRQPVPGEPYYVIRATPAASHPF